MVPDSVKSGDAQFLDSGAGMLEDTPIRIIYNRYSSQNYDLNLAYNNITLVSDGTDFYEKEGYPDTFFGKQLLIKDAESIIYMSFNVNVDKHLSTNDLLIEEGMAVFIIAEDSEID